MLIRKAAQEGMPWESARVVSEVVEMLVQRQRLPNFGNSGAIASLLNVAKVRVSLRLSRGEGGQALRLEDFSNRDAVQHSDDPWSRMHHTEHVQSLLHDLGAFVHAARADGLPVSSLMQQWHLIVTGPSGTGKTTTGQLMGAELHRLGLLPSATVIAESGQSLQGQYIGQTKELVVKAMERARGGVLLIDDAHLLAAEPGQKRSDYSAEAAQALVGALSSSKFKGKLVVVMCGPEEAVERIFASHAGLRQVIGSRRLRLPAWSGEQAAQVVRAEIGLHKRAMPEEALGALVRGCVQLADGPAWSSARDVFDVILPALYMAQAKRRAGALQGAGPDASSQRLALRMRKRQEIALVSTESQASRKGRRTVKRPEPALMYTAEDVEAAFADIRMTRGPCEPSVTPGSTRGDWVEEGLAEKPEALDGGVVDPEQEAGVRRRWRGPQTSGGNSAAVTVGMAVVGVRAQRGIREAVTRRGAADRDKATNSMDKAAAEMGWDWGQTKAALSQGSVLDERFVGRVMAAGSFATQEEARAAIAAAIPALPALLEKQEADGAVDEETRGRLQAMGACPNGFGWLRVEGGFRCAGGFHFVRDDQLSDPDAEP